MKKSPDLRLNRQPHYYSVERPQFRVPEFVEKPRK
jgi:hypothetical protein